MEGVAGQECCLKRQSQCIGLNDGLIAVSINHPIGNGNMEQSRSDSLM